VTESGEMSETTHTFYPVC